MLSESLSLCRLCEANARQHISSRWPTHRTKWSIGSATHSLNPTGPVTEQSEPIGVETKIINMGLKTVASADLEIQKKINSSKCVVDRELRRMGVKSFFAYMHTHTHIHTQNCRYTGVSCLVTEVSFSNGPNIQGFSYPLIWGWKHT
jgi:hypothetical protein